MQFSQQSSPEFLRDIVSSRNSDGFHLSGGIKHGCGGEKLFSRFMRQYLDNDTRYVLHYC